MRTPENYRAELDKLNEYFGGKGILTWKEIQQYTGKGYKWCSNHLKIPHGNCTVVCLAKALCKL